MAREIIPWRSTGGLRPFRSGMDDFWNRFFEERPQVEQARGWSPDIDVFESDSRVTVRAELPGMEADDIHVEVSQDLLVLRGEKKAEEEEKEGRFYCRERYAGSFHRSFQLPSSVQSEKVDAEFKNGVLTIRIPKSEQSRQKRIKIKSG